MDPFAEQPTDLNSPDDIALADRMKAGREEILSEIHKKIIGQREVINETLLTLFVGGNSLIIGVPGLAKTLLIQTMAQVLDLKFGRIQFTPDLMPSDITGTDIIQEDPKTGGRKMVFAPGPVFTNILLADEINRTPPKTQSALLEAMQEHRVTVQGRTYTLEEPFFVFATQNPIELEGTYPLPEAQLDRFMFHIVIEHPPEDEELEVVRSTTGSAEPDFHLSPTQNESPQSIDRRGFNPGRTANRPDTHLHENAKRGDLASSPAPINPGRRKSLSRCQWTGIPAGGNQRGDRKNRTVTNRSVSDSRELPVIGR